MKTLSKLTGILFCLTMLVGCFKEKELVPTSQQNSNSWNCKLFPMLPPSGEGDKIGALIYLSAGGASAVDAKVTVINKCLDQMKQHGRVRSDSEYKNEPIYFIGNEYCSADHFITCKNIYTGENVLNP